MVFAVAVATMPGGRTVAVTGSYDDTVRIWDLDSGEPVGDPLTATPARCGRWTGRDLDVDLSFLPSGTFTMDAYQDGVNADRMAGDYVKTKTQVTSGRKFRITLASGGGWAARIHQ